MTQILVPLNELRFGHEANPPINARKTGRLDDIEEYAASLEAHGLIQALNVKWMDAEFFVEDGNKRLAALRLLVERGRIAADMPVKCDPVEADVDSKERSMVANYIRAPLHEADTYEEMRDLHVRGMSSEKIAARFGLPIVRVERMLALGNLSPLILDAWREGTFERNAAECVRAFTMAPSLAEQERVFNDLKKDGQLYGNMIRARFGATHQNREAAKWVKIAGIERYTSAGGAITKDLFGDDHVVADAGLAEKLANEALGEKVEALIAEGWSWAAVGDALPQGWTYSWTKLTPSGKPSKAEAKRVKELTAIVDKPGGTYEAEQDAQAEIDAIKQAAEARGWSPEQKALAGAVVTVKHDGEVITVYGVVKPTPAKADKSSPAGAAADQSDKNPVISNAVANRLSVTATLATRAALLEEPRMGLVALLAAFVTKRFAYDNAQVCPLRVRAEGMGHQRFTYEESFPDALARLAAMDDADLFRIGAMIASQALELSVQTADVRPFSKASGALAAAIDPERLDAQLRSAFDAQDYFKSVSKPFAIAAIKAAISEDEAKRAANLKKPELVGYCVTNVPGTGWLPPELRTENYAGPM